MTVLLNWDAWPNGDLTVFPCIVFSSYYLSLAAKRASAFGDNGDAKGYSSRDYWKTPCL